MKLVLDARDYAKKRITVPAPPGTSDAMVVSTGFFLSYGALSESPPCTFRFRGFDDQHLALELVGVKTVGISPAGVEIEATAILNDDNRDNRWSGGIGYSLLFLGCDTCGCAPLLPRLGTADSLFRDAGRVRQWEEGHRPDEAIAARRPRRTTFLADATGDVDGRAGGLR